MRVERTPRDVCVEATPHLSCKRDQRKMTDYMDRRVIPPKRVTSPSWRHPPPCKHCQALKHELQAIFLIMVISAIEFYVKTKNKTKLEHCIHC